MKFNHHVLFLLFLPSIVFSQRIDFKALEKEVLEAENNRQKAAAFIALASSFPPPQASLTVSYADSVLMLSNVGDEVYYQNGSDYLKALGEYRRGNLGEAKILFKKIIKQLLPEDDLYFKANNFLGIIYIRTGSADSTLTVFNSLLEIIPLEDTKKRLGLYGNLGRAQRQLGNYSQAIQNFEKCVQLDSTNDFSVLNSYLNIASIFASLDLPERGIEILKKVDISKIPPQPIKAAYFNNIGEMYYENGEPDSALHYLRKGYELASSIKQYQQTIKNRLLITKIYLETNRINVAESTLKLIEVDLKYYPAPPILVDFNLTKVNFFIQKEQYDSAIFHSKEILKITKPKNLWQQKRNVYELLALSYDKIGKVEESRDYYKLYASFQDSLEQSESEQFKRDAAAKYKLQEKESLIASGELESTQLKQWQMVLLFGIFGLVLTTGVLTKRLRKSRSSHRVQIDENVELSKEIERNKSEIIELKSRAILQIDDIISIKADGHYLEFKLTSKEKPEIDRNRIISIMDNLPSKFIQIHRSHIVNIDFIKIKYADKVILNDGAELPVSRTFKKALNDLVKNS